MNRYITLSLSIVIVLISCKKDAVQNDQVASQGEILKQSYALDLSLTAPNDTISVSDYFYDNLNRCIEIRARSSQDSFRTSIYNYYSGIDTNIVSRKLYSVGLNGPNSQDSTWEYFTYTSNGQMLSDSIIEYVTGMPVSFNHTYQVVANNVIYANITDDGQPYLQARYYLQKDNNGNIISEVDTSFLYEPATGNYLFQTAGTVNLVYDNYRSPFYKMYPKRLVEVSFENLVAEFPIFQKNNVTSASFTRTQSGTTDQGSLSASFTYNSNGFPITGTPISGPAGTGFKVFYVYN